MISVQQLMEIRFINSLEHERTVSCLQTDGPDDFNILIYHPYWQGYKMLHWWSTNDNFDSSLTLTTLCTSTYDVPCTYIIPVYNNYMKLPRVLHKNFDLSYPKLLYDNNCLIFCVKNTSISTNEFTILFCLTIQPD